MERDQGCYTQPGAHPIHRLNADQEAKAEAQWVRSPEHIPRVGKGVVSAQSSSVIWRLRREKVSLDSSERNVRKSK